ncbi:hypothetical protein DRP44_06510 [candidate division TA06 bacterium]|uniref:PDZ domain-containing protein n=1 Tax=candidate division TA06 bacterium TaxID=2250710 RepID=A0A660S6I8_UNCT6|nr:MAG: hypothetical protein DRP44_06510 [candidate division TA06 bacterium]
MKKYLLYLIVLILSSTGCSTDLKTNTGKMYIKIATPYIANVEKNSNAYINGLRPGDRIIYINGKKIDRTADIYEESNNLTKIGVVDITIKRNFTTFKVTLRNGLSGISFQEQNYPSTLGFALYDIANAINRKLPYEYAAAIAGDIFSPFINEKKCMEEGENIYAKQNIEFIGKAIGLKFTQIYTSSNCFNNTYSLKLLYTKYLDYMKELIQNRGIILVHGGFGFPLFWNWGIIDSVRNDTLLGYTVGCGGVRSPIVYPPFSAYSVKYTGTILPLDSINIHIIKQIIALYSGNQNSPFWRTGFKAYEELEGIDNLNKFSQYMLNESTYELFWKNLKLNRQSENAFLYYSGMSKNRKIRSYLERIMRLNNEVINGRTPLFTENNNKTHINNYLNYVKHIAKLDSARIELYKKILLLY